MIDTILGILGYSGSDAVVTYICTMTCCVLVICMAYRLFDFLFSFISAIVGRNNKI